MKKLITRSGVTMVEVMLFLGLLGIIAGTIVSVLIDTQDARVRQHAIASLEQQGTHVLSTATKMIRRAERIILPAEGATGATLHLQMASNNEYPTILARIGSGITLVQKSSTAALITSNTILSNMSFRNVGDSNVWMSFTLTTIIPTLSQQIFSRTFNGTATLFPDDQSDAGGCGSCPAPSCIAGQYVWYVCESNMCTQSTTVLSC